MKNSFILIILLFSLNNYSQNYLRTIIGDSVNKSTKLKSDRFRSMWGGKIKGDKYDSPDFSLGEVNGNILLLRYNLYNDEFELKKSINGNTQFVERTLSKVVFYKTNKHFFLPYYYKGGKNFNVGYLSLITDLDSIRLYRKDEVKFKPATFSPTTIEIGFPPRFIKRKLFFIQKKEATPIQIGKRKLIKLIESLSLDFELQ